MNCRTSHLGHPLAVALALLLVPAFGFAQTALEWVTQANEHYSTGAYAEGADAYAQAIEAGAVNPVTFFNAACSAALAGRPDDAFQHLDGSIDRGWRDVEHLTRDSDLASLSEDPRWEELLQRCRQAEMDFQAALGHPGLRSEILEMKRVDQAMRRGESIPELEGKTWAEVDGAHTARMKEVVAEFGWLSKDMVGEDGVSAAWLLVQHADQEPAFQRECLDLMTALPAGEVDLVDLAYLTDRVRVNEGKKQLYGTQFWTVDGELVPRPIEDEAGLEARRAAAGMITMKEYTARITGQR